MEPAASKPPPAPINDPFTKPEPFVSQPLQMNAPPAPSGPAGMADLFGSQPPTSMLPPGPPGLGDLGFGVGPPAPGGPLGF